VCIDVLLSVPGYFFGGGERGSHHAASDGSAAQGVVLGEACATQLQGEEVRDGRLADQGVKERLQHIIRLRGEGGRERERQRDRESERER